MNSRRHIWKGAFAGALLATGVFVACGPGPIEPLDQQPTENTDGGSSSGCTDADVTGTSCSEHRDCEFSGKCQAGQAICDKTAGKCTIQAISYAKDEDTAPATLDLSCYGKPAEVTTTPATVTVIGCLEPFGVEATTTDLDVTFYDQSAIGTPLQATVKSVDPSTLGITCASDKNGAFKVSGLPTGKLLVAKVNGAPATSTFHDTYRFNILYSGADANAQGEITGRKAELSVISDITWTTIPPLMGLSAGITRGNGAIAGALEDCAGNSLANGLVALDPMPSGARFGYFNYSISDPKPSLARKATSVNGLFAAINVPPQKVSISGTIKHAGETLNLGTIQGEVFPNSVSILTIRGPLP